MHLLPLKCNPIHQQNLAQAHQHKGEGHSFSWQSFAAAPTEMVKIHSFKNSMQDRIIQDNLIEIKDQYKPQGEECRHPAPPHGAN